MKACVWRAPYRTFRAWRWMLRLMHSCGQTATKNGCRRAKSRPDMNIRKSLATCKGERRSRPCDTMWIKLNQVGIEIVHWEIQWEFPFIPIQWRSGCQSACWKIFDVEIFLKRWKSPILPSWYNSAVLSDHQHGTFRCLVIRNKLSAFGHSD